MEIDILVEEDRWNRLDLSLLTERALAATCAHLGVPANAVEISLLACDDARIAVLNRDFRGKATATNVLSWPAADLAADRPGARPAAPEPDPDGTLPLGDIALAFETCAREADSLDKPLCAHVSHLVIHGALHLLGYDHIRDPDATLMQSIEVEILGKLGIDDPYRE